MVTSRIRGAQRPPPTQYRPAALVYRIVARHGDFDWHGCSLDQVAARIQAYMPQQLRQGYQDMLNGEDPGREAMDWIDAFGPGYGFRTPNVVERARATGRADYLGTLGIEGWRLYEAVGRHTDSDMLRTRLAGPLRRGLEEASLPRVSYPSPAEVLVLYRTLAQQDNPQGALVRAEPFPGDVRGDLLRTWEREGEPAREGVTGERSPGAADQRAHSAAALQRACAPVSGTGASDAHGQVAVPLGEGEAVAADTGRGDQ